MALYKKIYHFLMLRCTGPNGVAHPPNDVNIEREVAAALESVFPRVGLRAFVALTDHERAAQLQELAGIVLGIRLFNQHQKKGGAGLPEVAGEKGAQLRSSSLLESVQKEVDELNDICKGFVDVILAATKEQPDNGRTPWDKLLSETETERARSDLMYHRQYLCYLLNLQEDIAGGAERLQSDQKKLAEEFVDLDALIGGRVSVPKEQVYPRFDALARSYRAAWREIQALEARGKLHTVLRSLREQYFPSLPASGQEMLNTLPSRDGMLMLEGDDQEDPVDLDAIPDPSSDPDGLAGHPVRLTLENSDRFLQLPLDFQGFCVHTLATRRVLVPGNPALGVVRYAGRYCVFGAERSCAEFCAEPDRYFGGIREVCYRHPELIHLLRIHEDFPKASLNNIITETIANQVPMQVDAGTETPIHFQESNIDKSYEWNEWKLRRDALHMADIKKKSTSATQTAGSHLRREGETQVYLPKEAATNTAVSRGTNPPRWRRYMVGMRGEPQPMQVTEIKFDL